MSSSAAQADNSHSDTATDKGKGKASEPSSHDVSMGEEDSSSEDEVDEVCLRGP